MDDAPATESWRELTTYGCNKEWWRSRRVRALRQPRVRVKIGEHVEEGADYAVSMCSSGPAMIMKHVTVVV